MRAVAIFLAVNGDRAIACAALMPVVGGIVRPRCCPIVGMFRRGLCPVGVKRGIRCVYLALVYLFTAVRRCVPAVEGIAVTSGRRQGCEFAICIGGGAGRGYCTAIGIEDHRIRISGNVNCSFGKRYGYRSAIKIGKIGGLVVRQTHGYGSLSAANHFKFQREQSACRIHVIFHVVPLHILLVRAAGKRASRKYVALGDCVQL